MSRNRHDRVTNHFGEDLDTNVELDGAVLDIPDGTLLHDALNLVLTAGEGDEETPPVNYADPDLGTIIYYFNAEVPELVQWAQGSGGITDFGATATLATPPTPGNKMILVYAYRGTGTNHSNPAGFTVHSNVQGDDFDGGRMLLFSKTAAIGESQSHFMAAASAHKKNVYFAEWESIGDFVTDTEINDTGATASHTTNSLAVTDPTIFFGGFDQSARNPSIAVSSPATEDWDVDVDSSGPSVVFGHRNVVDPGTYSMTAVSSHTESWGSFLAAFENTLDQWVLGPAIQDEDNDTYHTAAGDDCMRVALSEPILAYEAIIRMAFSTGVERTYGIYGTNESDFSDLTLLTETTFTPLGSDIDQNILFGWPATTTYQYYVLIGPSENRQIHELQLHGLVGVVSTNHPLTIHRDLPNQHPADAVTFDDGIAVLGEDDLQGAIEKLSLNAAGGYGLSAIIGNVSTGVKFDLEMPFAGSFSAARLLADQTGSIVVDLWKNSYPNLPPTVADTICASAKPTINSEIKSQDTTLTGWTTDFDVGDVVRVNVESASTLTRATLALRFGPSVSSPAVVTIQLGRINRTAVVHAPEVGHLTPPLIDQTAVAHSPTVT